MTQMEDFPNSERLIEQLIVLANAPRRTADVIDASAQAMRVAVRSSCVHTGVNASRFHLRPNGLEGIGRVQLDQWSGPISHLEAETRAVVDTRTAAFHLGRKEQTLRTWACRDSGPTRPFRINGRLAWPVVELMRTLRVR